MPLASLPDSGEEEVEAVLMSYLEANSVSFPCHLGDELDEEAKTVMLVYLVIISFFLKVITAAPLGTVPERVRLFWIAGILDPF